MGWKTKILVIFSCFQAHFLRFFYEHFKTPKKVGGKTFKNWVCNICQILSRTNILQNKDDWPTWENVISVLKWNASSPLLLPWYRQKHCAIWAWNLYIYLKLNRHHDHLPRHSSIQKMCCQKHPRHRGRRPRQTLSEPVTHQSCKQGHIVRSQVQRIVI
jgi:hypothetical protein